MLNEGFSKESRKIVPGRGFLKERFSLKQKVILCTYNVF